MADAVTPITKEIVINSSLKQGWLDQCAKAFDAFVEQTGQEPDAMFMVSIGYGKVRSTWHICDDRGAWADHGNTHGALLVAAKHLERQAWVDVDEAR